MWACVLPLGHSVSGPLKIIFSPFALLGCPSSHLPASLLLATVFCTHTGALPKYITLNFDGVSNRVRLGPGVTLTFQVSYLGDGGLVPGPSSRHLCGTLLPHASP